MKWLELFIGLLCSLFAFQASAEMPKAGAFAPDFTLPSQDGKPVTLSELKGKWVVLYFYPKDFTPGCNLEAKNFQADLPKYTEKNAVIVGVSVDSAASHKEFCTKQGLGFTLLADEQHKVSDMYDSFNGVMGMGIAARNTFLIDPKGIISKVYKSVSPMKHSQEVLEDLSALQTSAR